MSTKSDGGFAFPAHPSAGSVRLGMTMRDYFAALAMQGMLAGNTYSYESMESDADIAYRIADAMLKERAK